MLHATPTSDTKVETAQSKTQVVPQPERELHPRLLSPAGLYSPGGMSGVASGTSPEVQRRQAFAGMQSAHGNQAVLRMLHSPQQVAHMPALRPSQSIMLQRKCACGGSSESGGECAECKAEREEALQSSTSNETVSPKLVINKPGDRYEQEADFVAEQVMRMPEENLQRQLTEKEGAIINRKISSGHTMPLIQRQDDQDQPDQRNVGEATDEEELTEMEEANVAPSLQRKYQSGATNKQTDEQKSLRSALARKNEGIPLDRMTHSFMESRFGHDFSQVRLHTNDHADKAARSIRARAFTVGQNIWFAHGEFSPTTYAGRHLLAHELTHTIQQRGNSVSTIQREICPEHCKASVSAGDLCEASKVTRDHCGDSDAKDAKNMITHIQVLLDTRKVRLFWNGASRTCKGTKTEIDCTPNPGPKGTPKGGGIIGQKCGINHTSYPGKKSGKIHSMAYFTAFHDGDMRYGFHDSQPLGSGYHSAGCVRVSCEDAKMINENTSSGKTSVNVKASAKAPNSEKAGDCEKGDTSTKENNDNDDTSTKENSDAGV